MTAPLSLEVKDGVATLTIQRPERSNALRLADFDLLAELLQQAEAASGARAIVLTGSGERAFCAGADLAEGPRFERADGRTGLGHAMRVASRLAKPILARVNGACMAGGMGLLGLCRAAVAVDDARFALPEIRHGFFPHVAVAAWRAHPARAHVQRLAESGGAISAAEAARLGIIARAIPRADLDAATAQAVERLLADEDSTSAARQHGLCDAVDMAERRLFADLAVLKAQTSRDAGRPLR